MMKQLLKLSLWPACLMMLQMLFSCTSSSENLDSSLIPVKTEGGYGYINLNGEWIIDPRFDTAEPFTCGYALVNKDNIYGYIDKKGNFTINPQYEDAQSFSEGLAWVKRNGSAPILIDTEGKEIIELKDAITCDYFSDGRSQVVTKDHKYGYVDNKGNFVIQPEYDFAKDFINGLAYVEIKKPGENDFKGFIDKDNKVVITFPDTVSLDYELFKRSMPFINGLADVRIGNQVGLMDKTGKIVAKTNLRGISMDNEDMYICADGSFEDEEYGWCDKEGNVIIEPQFSIALPFGSNSLAAVCVNGKWGYINKKGNFVMNPQFEGATPFINDKVAFVKNDNRELIMIDKNGNRISNSLFYDINSNFLEYSLFPVISTPERPFMPATI